MGDFAKFIKDREILTENLIQHLKSENLNQDKSIRNKMGQWIAHEAHLSLDKSNKKE